VKVVIEIALGNEQMQSAFHAAQAAQAALVTGREGKHSTQPLVRGDAGTVRDVNGNTVGTWRVER
jgi:hypothetical protein